MHIRRQQQRVPVKGVVLASPKTRGSIRTIQIGSETLSLVQDYLERWELRSNARVQPDDIIFSNSAKNPILRRQIQREFKKILALNNLPDIRFHDLRHTAGSLLLAIGMPILQVSRQLGHSQASTTLDIYGHLIPGLPSNSAEKIDKLLAPAPVDL